MVPNGNAVGCQSGKMTGQERLKPGFGVELCSEKAHFSEVFAGRFPAIDARRGFSVIWAQYLALVLDPHGSAVGRRESESPASSSIAR